MFILSGRFECRACSLAIKRMITIIINGGSDFSRSESDFSLRSSRSRFFKMLSTHVSQSGIRFLVLLVSAATSFHFKRTYHLCLFLFWGLCLICLFILNQQLVTVQCDATDAVVGVYHSPNRTQSGFFSNSLLFPAHIKTQRHCLFPLSAMSFW